MGWHAVLRAIEEAFIAVADCVTPALVNVSTHARSQGSRVVVDPMGYILTVPQAEDDVLERPRTP